MRPADVSIRVQGGVLTLLVNGQDLSDEARALRLSWAYGAVAVLELELGVDASAEAQALVEAPHEAAEDVVSFLNAIDPAELDRVVLEGMGLGDGPVMAQVLEVLKGWARGA